MRMPTNHRIILSVCLMFWPALASAQPTTLARIKQEGVLRWGADPSGGAPFAFNDPSDPDQVIGFEVEIVAGLAKHLGVRPELVKGDWDSLIPSLKARRIDLVINGFEITAKRQ